MLRAPLRVNVNATLNCNLRCPYCHSSSGPNYRGLGTPPSHPQPPTSRDQATPPAAPRHRLLPTAATNDAHPATPHHPLTPHHPTSPAGAVDKRASLDELDRLRTRQSITKRAEWVVAVREDACHRFGGIDEKESSGDVGAVVVGVATTTSGAASHARLVRFMWWSAGIRRAKAEPRSSSRHPLVAPRSRTFVADLS